MGKKAVKSKDLFLCFVLPCFSIFYIRDDGGEDAETAYFANVCGFVKAVFRLVSWRLILKYGSET